MIVQIMLTIVDAGLADWSPLSSLFSLLTLLPWLGVSVRRLHDINRSGWWLFATFVMFMLIGVTAVMALGSLGGAVDGATAEPSGSMLVGLIVAVMATLGLCIALLVFAVTPGTDGPNDYGPDPYGRDNLEAVFA